MQPLTSPSATRSRNCFVVTVGKPISWTASSCSILAFTSDWSTTKETHLCHHLCDLIKDGYAARSWSVTSTPRMNSWYMRWIGFDGTVHCLQWPFLRRNTHESGDHGSASVASMNTVSESRQLRHAICLCRCMRMINRPLCMLSGSCFRFLGMHNLSERTVPHAQVPPTWRSWNRRGEEKKLSHTRM